MKIHTLESAQAAETETSYKEIIAADQFQNRSRAQELAILPEAAKQQIAEAAKYSSYFPNPITKPFMRKYILSKLEFPTKSSELAQSMTELNVRVDNLFNDAYSYKKAELEIDKLDVQIRKLEQKIVLSNDSLDKEELEIEKEEKILEKNNKKISLNKIKLAAMARYNEAIGWKGCVEDIMKELGVTSLEEVDFNQVRMDEMAAKVKKWGELEAAGHLEMTPTKFNVIYDNTEKFAEGHQEASAKIKAMQKAQISQN